jgi:hypothetical protein
MKDIIELAREAGFHFHDAGYAPEVLHTEPHEYSQKCFERFAALVRAEVLEEAAGVTGELAQKWWSIHCASNKHMETTRKAHDDFCALQAAIRALRG